ncbi:hypothetical protein OT109_13805 [Phycisphaeraceae bacterium D3-23]
MPHVPLSEPTTTRRAVRIGIALLTLVFAWAIALPASADQLQRNGQWQNVTIVGVEDGELVYRNNAGGTNTVALADVESLDLDDEAEFRGALEAFQGEDYRRSQRMFGEIAEQTRIDWVRHYAQFFLVQSLDQRGEPVEAATVFAQLARDGADPYFLSVAPMASLAAVSDDERARIREEVVDVLGDTEGVTRERLQNYLLAVVGEEAMPDLTPIEPNPNPGTGTDNAAQLDRSQSAVILPEALWEILEAEEFDAEKWGGLTLLREGKYEEAVEAITPWMEGRGDMPEKLFILGRAQLALADASEDRDDYLDAGLTFMRIVVHYENLGTPLLAPSRLELAYLHRVIGREDLYDKLLNQSDLFLSFADDPETYPQYYQRYYEIIGEPVPVPDADE